MLHSVFRFRLRPGLLSCIAVIFLFSVACMYMALYWQPGSLSATLEILNQSDSIIYLLNWLPIFLITLFLFFVLGNCALACGITAVTVGALSVANFYKLDLRQAPLMHWDLLLGGEVMGVAQSFDVQMLIVIAGFILALITALVLALIFIVNLPPLPPVRIGGAAAAAIAMLLCYSLVYGSDTLYDSMHVEGNVYNESDRFNSRGFVYSFVHGAAVSKLTKPDGYNAQELAAFLEAPPMEGHAPQEKPHIIMIMSEAFSDFALDPAFDFTGYTDPLAHYRQIKSEAISGHIAVPNVGGGTADTEFDVLTGINSRHYRTVPYTYSLVRRPVPSLVSALKAEGYDNVAIHPGHPWFYNRTNVYQHLGFDRFLTILDFDEKTQLKATYINETAAFDAIIREFENHTASSDTPFFDFCVTIQNHGPYFEHYEAEKNFNTNLYFNDRDMDSLYNYFHGLADADRELNRLTEYLQASVEPVVLVYFGDHLPAISNEAYDVILPEGQLETASETTRLVSTPYIIWANAAAHALVNESVTPPASVISSPYLSALLMEYIGIYEPYFNYLGQVSRDYPLLLEGRYATPDGLVIPYSQGTPQEIEILRRLEYYRFFEG